MIKVLTIEEIKQRMNAMRSNRKRGFSIQEFSRFAGIDYRNLKKMFFENKMVITELTQRKLSKALLALETGEAGLRLTITGERILDYHPRKEQKPALKKGFNIYLTGAGANLSVGPVNRYSFNINNIFNKQRG
jgi:hypothetical protein